MRAAELPEALRLADIAAAAGVSLPTVSRALSGRGRVKEATRARILTIAHEAGYRPRVAPATPTLAIVVYDSDTAIVERQLGHGYGSFDQRVLGGISALAQETGAQLMLAHTSGDLAAPLPPALAPAAATGALLLGGMFPESFVNTLAERLPIVLAGSFIPGGRINCVHPDYQTGALLATQHLLELGHRRIALLNGPLSTRSSAEKEAGYREALRAAGLAVRDGLLVRATDFAVEDGKRATAQLLEREAFTGLVAADDTLAFGAVRLLGERGRRAPDAISVVGFYDGPLAPVCDPPLTTINIHHHAIGSTAARRLLDMVRNPQGPVLRIVVAPQLVVRGSTRSVSE